LNILHVYKTYFPDTQGGLEEAIRQICRGTGSYGAHNHIFTLSKTADPQTIRLPEATVWRSRRLVQIASCDIATPKGIRDFKQRVEECDIVHYQFPWPFADMLHILTRVRKPSVVTYQSDIVRQQNLLRLYRPMMLRFLASVDSIVATSPNYAATSPFLRKFPSRVCVIPLGLDETPEARPDRDLLRSWENRVGRDFFLFVGVLRYYKGLDYLIEAVKNTRLRVVIVGTGPEERRLKYLAKGLDNVTFLGFVDDHDKYALLRLSRCVVFPSHLRSEAFGMTLLEGALMSKPLITAEIGTGTSYININNETGLVVPPSDPIALREAMYALAGDESLARRMGLAARSRYEEMFTGSAVGKQYYNLYGRLLAREAGS